MQYPQITYITSTMMKSVVLVALFCSFGALGAPTDNNRIVGGHNAQPGEFPHQISMQKNRQHFCGGSIVSPTKIVTAAHCVYGMSGPMDVVAGTNNLAQEGQRIPVAKAIYHSGYDPTTTVNDIAVLILSAPLIFNSNVNPITLATSNPAPGAILTLSGWGYTQYPPTGTPNLLQTVELTNLDLQQCASLLAGANPITTGHVCTTSRVGMGACQGDSGGPLIQGNILVGVVSWGVPCAVGRPDVFTSVAFFRDFIVNTN